jgi:hypothetical protein
MTSIYCSTIGLLSLLLLVSFFVTPSTKPFAISVITLKTFSFVTFVTVTVAVVVAFAYIVVFFSFILHLLHLNFSQHRSYLHLCSLLHWKPSIASLLVFTFVYLSLSFVTLLFFMVHEFINYFSSLPLLFSTPIDPIRSSTHFHSAFTVSDSKYS